jgi:hypothetical protein
MYFRLLIVFAVALGSAEAAHPLITFNNQTGSDTGASGAPASIGPIFAAATCNTGGVVSNTINWPANGLQGAGVPTDGSAILWLNTASGRQFTQIFGFTANTVTVDDQFNIASGIDCAVGGKRRTIAGSLQVFPDVKGDHGLTIPGWTIQFDGSTGINYTSGTTLSTVGITKGCKIQSTPGTGMAVIEGTANGVLFDLGHNCEMANLQLINTNATKTLSIGVRNVPQTNGIIVGGSSSAQGFYKGVTNVDCTVDTTYASEIRFNVIGIDDRAMSYVIANWIHDNTTGINVGSSCNKPGLYFRNLIVRNNVGIVLTSVDTGILGIVEDTIDSNVSHGIDFASDAQGKMLVNNQITNNGGAGVRCNAGTADCGRLRGQALVAFNNYYNNAGGDRVNWPVGENETNNAPNYTNPGANNYCPKGSSRFGGPPVPPNGTYANSATKSVNFQGACQPNLLTLGLGINIGI